MLENRHSEHVAEPARKLVPVHAHHARQVAYAPRFARRLRNPIGYFDQSLNDLWRKAFRRLRRRLEIGNEQADDLQHFRLDVGWTNSARHRRLEQRCERLIHIARIA